MTPDNPFCLSVFLAPYAKWGDLGERVSYVPCQFPHSMIPSTWINWINVGVIENEQ